MDRRDASVNAASGQGTSVVGSGSGTARIARLRLENSQLQPTQVPLGSTWPGSSGRGWGSVLAHSLVWQYSAMNRS